MPRRKKTEYTPEFQKKIQKLIEELNKESKYMCEEVGLQGMEISLDGDSNPYIYPQVLSDNLEQPLTKLIERETDETIKNQLKNQLEMYTALTKATANKVTCLVALDEGSIVVQSEFQGVDGANQISLKENIERLKAIQQGIQGDNYVRKIKELIFKGNFAPIDVGEANQLLGVLVSQVEKELDAIALQISHPVVELIKQAEQKVKYFYETEPQ